MNRSLLVLVVLVALLVAGGLGYVLLRSDGPVGEEGAVERETGEPGDAALVTLRGRAGAGLEEAPASSDAASSDAPGDAAPEAAGQVVLLGTIRGLDAVPAGAARVRVFPVSGLWADREEEPAACIADADGRFTLDLTALFARATDLTHVDVVVDHPACVQAVSRLDATAARRAGRGELRATITLRPGLAIVGEVVDGQGGAIPGADVALFVIGDDIPTYEHILPVQPQAQDRSDEEGRYRLRVSGPGRYLVVAASEGRQPAGLELRLGAGAEHDVAPLVLVPGVAIAGRLLHGDRGVAQAYVNAEPANEERTDLPLQVGGGQVYWSPGPVLRCGGEGMTDDDGSFRVVGLSPGTHRVGVYGVSLPGIDDVSPALAQRLGGVLEAPVEDAVIEVEGALLELRTTLAGRPVGGVGLQVSAGGSSSLWETAEHGGVLRVLVPPAVELSVGVVDGRYESTSTQATSGPAGSTVFHEVPLVEAAPRPSLLVTFEGPGAEVLEEVWFQPVPRTVGTPAAGEAPPPPAPPTAMLDVEKVEPGTFRVSGMPPGPSTLLVHPGTGYWEDAGYHLEIRQDVVLPAAGEVALRLTLRTGGRLRIAARDAAGALLEAECAIRDARGAEQTVTFSTHSENVAMSQGGSLGDLSPSLVAPPLQVGRYTIELSLDGYEPRTLTAEVKAGETTEVDVVLVKR